MTIRYVIAKVCAFLLVSSVLLSGIHGYSQTATQTKNTKARTQNIILITVDTLRADHLGCYGYRRASTPVIDGLAKEGIRFTNATAQVPLTLPSHYSILTGTFPFYHGIRDNSRGTAGGPLLVSEMLHRAGYRTGAFIASYILDSRFGLNRGFDLYYDDFDVSLADSADVSSIRRPAEEVINKAIEWIGASRKPFFAWIHLYDLHTPYPSPLQSGTHFRSSPYDSQIAHVDWCLGRLIDFLRQRNSFAHTHILFTSDHGEGLGDHSEPAHGLFVYESTIHVPLVVHKAEESRHGDTVDRLVQSVDVAPTILAFAGLSPARQMQGTLLREIFAPAASLSRQDADELGQWSYFETLYPQRHFGWSGLRGIKTGRYKYVDAPRPELFDLLRDPGETTNLFQHNTALAAQMKELLYTKLAEYGMTTPAARGRAGGPESVQKLSSLGYLSGNTQMVHAANSGGKDPKDGIELYLKISEALELSNQGKPRAAAQVLEEVLAKAPEMTSARMILGALYERAGEYAKASAQYAQAAVREPENPLLYFNLGNVFSNQRDLDGAISQYRQALKTDPEFVSAHTALGIAYRKQKRWHEAVEEFTEALKSGPNYVARYNLAAIYVLQGQLGQALAQARLAAALQPEHFEVFNLLGSIYLLNNRNSEAEESFRHALRLNSKSDEALTNLAQVLTRTARLDEAQELLREALEINPSREDARILLAKFGSQTP